MSRHSLKTQEVSHFQRLDNECREAAYLAVADWLTDKITDQNGNVKTWLRVVDLTEYDLRAIAGNAGCAWSVKAAEQSQQALNGARETHWIENIYLGRFSYKTVAQDMIATRMVERARSIERPNPKNQISLDDRGTFLAMADIALAEADKNVRVFYCCRYLRKQKFLGSEAAALLEKYDQYGATDFTIEEITFLENLTDGAPL